MKHIVIDCRMIQASGIANYMLHVIPGLLASGRFKISCLGNIEILKTFSWAEQVNLISFNYKIFSPLEQIGFLTKVPSCDVIWFPQYHSPFYRLKAKKRITTIHDLMQFRLKDHYSLIERAYLGFYLRNAILQSDHLITVSDFTKRELEDLFPSATSKIQRVHLAVDDDYTANIHKHSERGKYVLYVGNVKPHKNLLMALKAFRRSKLTDYVFYIVGRIEGFYSGDAAITKTIEDMGDRVQFTGYVNDEELKDYYANASLFLFPSRYEGFGLPILEAMKFNIPILSSDAASLKEIGGDAIHYFDAGNVDELVDSLDAFAEGNLIYDYTKYSQNIKRFSWETTIDEHIRILSE